MGNDAQLAVQPYKHFLRWPINPVNWVRVIQFLVFDPSSAVGLCMHDYKFICSGSRSLKVTELGTNRKLICDFLLVNNSNLPPILHRFRDIPFDKSLYLFQTEGFLWDDLRKILPGSQQMANVPNGVETLLKISMVWVDCTNVTDRRQMMTYSEREREFTFANKTVKTLRGTQQKLTWTSQNPTRINRHFGYATILTVFPGWCIAEYVK